MGYYSDVEIAIYGTGAAVDRLVAEWRLTDSPILFWFKDAMSVTTLAAYKAVDGGELRLIHFQIPDSKWFPSYAHVAAMHAELDDLSDDLTGELVRVGEEPTDMERQVYGAQDRDQFFLSVAGRIINDIPEGTNDANQTDT